MEDISVMKKKLEKANRILAGHRIWAAMIEEETGKVKLHAAVFTFVALSVGWYLEKENNYPLFWALAKTCPQFAIFSLFVAISLLTGICLSAPYAAEAGEARIRSRLFEAEAEELERKYQRKIEELRENRGD